MRELIFLIALWKANLLAAMEYRVSFLTQVFGMMLNNGIYFLFWVIFFDRFKQVQGWTLRDMFLLFGVTAAGFGLSVFLFGNVTTLAEVIVTGRLDYYLSLPRPVLLHVLASSSRVSGLGDFVYGILSFLVAGQITAFSFLRFLVGLALAMVVFLSFLVLIQSLAFWIGSASLLSAHAINAILTFALYPITLFDGGARLILFTLIPAAFIGAVPVEIIRSFTWLRLGELILAALAFLLLALTLFHRGLRRYESGSAIQAQV